MSHCVNFNNPDVIDIAKQLKVSPPVAGAKIAIWQEKNGLDNFPTANDLAGVVAQTKTIEDLESQLVDGFLKDFGISHTEYEDMKKELGIDAYRASDLINKSIAYEKGESILPEVAYFAYSMLGKENNKVRSELRYLVNKWPKYKERFALHSKLTKDKFGFIGDKDEWRKKIRDMVILDFLQEKLEQSYFNPTAFEKSMDTRWTKEDFTIWNKIKQWFEDLLSKFSDKHKSHLEKLDNVGLAIADEVLNKNYEYFNYGLSEDQVQKKYHETLNKDQFAKNLVEFAQKELGIVLTGSLALRKAGKVYRSEEETIHDIDFTIPYEKNDSEANTEIYNAIMSPTYNNEELKKAASIAAKHVEKLDWFKKFKEKYPSFKLTNTFYGAGNENYDSLTVAGVVDGEIYAEDGYHMEDYSYVKKSPEDKSPVKVTQKRKVKHKKGELVKNTGYAIDFFVRLKPSGEQHQNYFKVWKEIMIAKITMGRGKDFSDWKAFEPYVPSDNAFNFNYAGFRNIGLASTKDVVLENPRTSRHPQTATSDTVRKMKDFLTRIGVDVQTVNSIVVGGIKQDANAAAFMNQKLVQVVNGMEAQALPEEAMHFAIEIIEQKDPKLFNELLKDIHNYETYKDVIKEYATNPLYQTADGKPDIRKLKKEAMGKVLAETIINLNENRRETPERIQKAQSWWEKIIESIKNIFSFSGFDTLAMNILAGDNIGNAEDIKLKQKEAVYLQQAAEQTRIYNQIKDVHNRITKKTVKNPQGGEEEKYFIDGKEIAKRVSNVIKTWFDVLSADKALTNSEYQNALNTLKADKGTDGHKDMEYIFDLFIDEDGNLRDVPKDDAGYQSRLNPADREMYDVLKQNFEDRLATYPKGTRFMTEATIYDPNRKGGDVAGTVDFLAIKPNGHVDILDWKFKSLYTDQGEDIPWYNINAWNRQMEQYKTIINKVYGVKAENFDQTMMIPIRAHYSGGNATQGILPQLAEIEIGDVNVKNITEDYLIPVGLEAQRTSSPKLDKLLTKLRALYKKLSEQKVLPAEKASKSEQLNALFKAIRHLQMKESIEPLLDQAQTLNKQMEYLIKKYDDVFKGKDKSEFTDGQINDFTRDLHSAEEVLESYKELNRDLSFMFQGELSEEDKKLKKDLRKVAETASDYKDKLGDIYTDFTLNFVGGTINAEKVVKGFTRWFGTSATIQLKGLQEIYKKAGRALGFASMDTNTEFKRLTQLKDNYLTWAANKGLDKKNMFNAIKKPNSNELIDEFKHEFYTEVVKRVQNKDYAWIKDNINVTEYKEHLNKLLQEELTRIDNKAYSGDEELARFRKQRDITNARDKYSISTPTSHGWLLRGEIYKYPDPGKWTSDEWKNLNKPENTPALDFYNYIKERNEYYASIGYINNQQARTFLPWVRKSFTEKLVFGGKVSLGEQFLRNISVDEGTVGYGAVDPLTGQLIDKIPKYFTSELEDDYSTDLFKNMFLYNEMAIKFKYMTDIEYQSRSLIRLEKNKNAIATSVFGRTSLEPDGSLKVSPNNSENSALIEDMVKSIVYGQKYIESATFDMLIGKLDGFTTKVNSTLGFKLMPENLKNREISINRSLDALNNMFQLKTLGLNPLSSFSNYFGGKTHSWINSGKYFTKQDYVNTEMWLLANKLGGSDKQKMLAALDYFMPFLEKYNKDASKKLSLKPGVLDENAVQDFLMVLMRNGEEAVQATNFYAFLRHAIVMNGEVLNTREYLRTTPEYVDFYAGSAEDRRKRADKFEEDVLKLNESHGLLKLGTVDKEGNFVIPGIEQKSNTVIDFRRTVQAFSTDALGSMSAENKRMVNMTVYGNSLMVFKNWIPRLVDVRFGAMKYNAASDAYEWGRSRMVAKVISEDVLKSIGRLRNSLIANDKGVEYMREMFETNKRTYYEETGKELDMTEAEFINLMRTNIRNQIHDLMVYATLSVLCMWGLKALAPDDDEDPRIKNTFKFIQKATDKLKDELHYFYDPRSLAGLTKGEIFPALGLIEDYTKALYSTLAEVYGLVQGDTELVDDNNSIKYWMKTMPFASQAASLLPMFAPDLAKDLGIQMQSQYGFGR